MFNKTENYRVNLLFFWFNAIKKALKIDIFCVVFVKWILWVSRCNWYLITQLDGNWFILLNSTGKWVLRFDINRLHSHAQISLMSAQVAETPYSVQSYLKKEKQIHLVRQNKHWHKLDSFDNVIERNFIFKQKKNQNESNRKWMPWLVWSQVWLQVSQIKW